MESYKCELGNITFVHSSEGSYARAYIKMLASYENRLFGEWYQTSKIKSIDFERGLIVTQNSLYIFK